MGTHDDSSDIIGFIKDQHDKVKAMIEQVISTRGAERAKAFRAMRRMIAVHEAVEEEVVHPVARRALLNGDSTVDARLSEEREVKKLLSELEPLGVDSAEFDRKLEELRAVVVAHTQAEEREELEGLRNQLDAKRLVRMRAVAALAEKVAPTHPHAGIESAAGNLIIGPFAAIFDRARDAFFGKA
jgi:hypothetical protein